MIEALLDDSLTELEQISTVEALITVAKEGTRLDSELVAKLPPKKKWGETLNEDETRELKRYVREMLDDPAPRLDEFKHCFSVEVRYSQDHSDNMTCCMEDWDEDNDDCQFEQIEHCVEVGPRLAPTHLPRSGSWIMLVVWEPDETGHDERVGEVCVLLDDGKVVDSYINS